MITSCGTVSLIEEARTFSENVADTHLGTKNVQLGEIYQDMCSGQGSENFFLLGPICGPTRPPPSFNSIL
jgi:hypothetical protein